ncbi:carbohydrate ABC transporter permease [Cohnella nanjingensis]|uniref:Sugar ABC transporter permease n=1 Tax=Cohnella nanjingensis TaxID=1387779 RepID=A0A7X0RQN3_9BACL|nr:sugar ABC transporter permease [Cohnella nanjingensis]MBB6670489.1 sugar ABC transporter permease [Cohnella nanjingensis]
MREELKFLGYILPWLVGFLLFFLVPAGASMVYSFTDYNAIKPPHSVGWSNYSRLFEDPIYLKSLRNTLFFVFIGVPCNLLFQILVSSLLNVPRRGVSLFRTFYYLPYLVPMIATVMIFRLIFSTDYGIVNHALDWFGIAKIGWLEKEAFAKPIIVLMNMWAAGSGILIFLAALKGVPRHLYEAATMDGAGKIRSFFVITLPMITPAILFSLVMQMIANFQLFTEAYLLNKGGPNYASSTYMLNTYNTGFRDFKFGLAMAQSWILTLIILVITVVVLATSRRWVYYEGGDNR